MDHNMGDRGKEEYKQFFYLDNTTLCQQRISKQKQYEVYSTDLKSFRRMLSDLQKMRIEVEYGILILDKLIPPVLSLDQIKTSLNHLLKSLEIQDSLQKFCTQVINGEKNILEDGSIKQEILHKDEVLDDDTTPVIDINLNADSEAVKDTASNVETVFDTSISADLEAAKDTISNREVAKDTSSNVETVNDTSPDVQTVFDTNKSVEAVTDNTVSVEAEIDTTSNVHAVIDTISSVEAVIDTTNDVKVKNDNSNSDTKMNKILELNCQENLPKLEEDENQFYIKIEMDADKKISTDFSESCRKEESLKSKIALNIHNKLSGSNLCKCGRPGIKSVKSVDEVLKCSQCRKDEKPFTCDVCDKKFVHRGHLRDHILIHSGQKPFECDICNQTFARLRSKISHMANHLQEKPFKCDICGKGFGIKRVLTKHMRIHTGEKNFKCDICAKYFVSNFVLKVHMRRHTGERPYKCDQCLKMFTQNSSLTDHMRIHTGEKPFKCDQCIKEFSTKSILRKHLLSHARKT